MNVITLLERHGGKLGAAGVAVSLLCIGVLVWLALASSQDVAKRVTVVDHTVTTVQELVASRCSAAKPSPAACRRLLTNLLLYATPSQLAQLHVVGHGLTGPRGGRGRAGHDGATGPRGATGKTGPRGVAGLQGTAGHVGATGARGAMGPPGPPGPRGATGASASVTATL